MELNSLGAAREDTHGTPEKLRGKMYSFFCFFFLSFSFSLSFTLVPRACHSPTLSAFSATSLPFHSYGNHPRTLSLLAHFSFWNSSAATRVATRRQRGLRRFLSPCSLPSSSTNPSFRCKWPFYVDSCSFSWANMPWQMYIYIYAHACMILRSFTRLLDRKYEGNRRNLIATVHSNDFKTRHGCDRWKLTGTCLPFLFLSFSLLFSFFLFFLFSAEVSLFSIR